MVIIRCVKGDVALCVDGTGFWIITQRPAYKTPNRPSSVQRVEVSTTF